MRDLKQDIDRSAAPAGGRSERRSSITGKIAGLKAAATVAEISQAVEAELDAVLAPDRASKLISAVDSSDKPHNYG